MSNVWELDGLRLRVTLPTGSGTVDDPLPAAFGWASAMAEHVTGSMPIAATTEIDGLVVTCTWPPNTLKAGTWRVQVRAGETQLSARTIYNGETVIGDSIQA